MCMLAMATHTPYGMGERHACWATEVVVETMMAVLKVTVIAMIATIMILI